MKHNVLHNVLQNKRKASVRSEHEELSVIGTPFFTAAFNATMQQSNARQLALDTSKRLFNSGWQQWLASNWCS